MIFCFVLSSLIRNFASQSMFMMQYADVILPVPLYATFTYAIPEGMKVVEGVRVLVPFGRGKKYVGLVDRVHDQQPQGYAVKGIETVMAAFEG